MAIILDTMYAGTPRLIGSGGKLSAILKSPLPGPWTIAPTGLVGDAQADLENHGGLEKALHHYPQEHYGKWLSELPGIAEALAYVPAFGENISTQGMTEDRVCIGDVYRIGDVILQVSQGRQPCWKLNARFNVADMAYRVQKTGRTGWYYRVLKSGAITTGDAIELQARPQPDWPLSRIVALLYHRTTVFDELASLAEVRELADGWRKLAARRVAARAVESWESRLKGDAT